MSKILKSSFVKVDNENRVSIDIKKNIDMTSITDVIEADNFKMSMVPPPIYIIEQARKNAKMIIENAEARGKKILDQARELSENMAEEIELESREKGYQEGYQAGFCEVNSLKEDAMEKYDEAVKEKENIISFLEADILELIINIVDKLLVNSVYINPQIIMVLIKNGLSASSLTGDIKIRVSSKDYDYVSENIEEIYKYIDASISIQLMKDLSISKADCVIETNLGNIDCGLNQQFQSLKESLQLIYEAGGFNEHH